MRLGSRAVYFRHNISSRDEGLKIAGHGTRGWQESSRQFEATVLGHTSSQFGRALDRRNSARQTGRRGQGVDPPFGGPGRTGVGDVMAGSEGPSLGMGTVGDIGG